MDGDPHKAHLYVLANLYEKLGNLYGKTGNNTESLSSYFKSVKIAASIDDKVGLSFYNGDLGNYYLEANKLDSALFFLNKSLGYSNASGFKLYRGGALRLIGKIYFQKGNLNTAKKYFFESIKTNKEQNNQQYLPYAYISLADLYKSTGKSDSCIYYARLALGDFKNQEDNPGINEAYTTLFAAYKLQGQTDSAFFYLQHSKTLGDSLNEAEKAKISQYLNVGFDQQLQVQELEKEKIQVQTRIRTYVMLAGIFIFMLVALLLYRNNRNRKKANLLLQQQKEKVESALHQLKSTQTQLIQSEKMASLGELTAGIAHEIQNPLNFVNNFSEVNTELIDELLEDRKKEIRDFKNEDELLKDIKQNLEKINHHGKRADAIVKGMLQHSRSSNAIKEPTDINKLADEYLRLSYHGLRAKDKSFNATMQTDFDESIGKISIVPQDIGRVLLNLYNNAFYAVNEKSKHQNENYEPTVSISTKKINNKIEVRVKDNGNGIPQKVVDKIFQPFFTTKPTGQGTGLGLSLSYDIIKASGGEIIVETEEGEGSEFIMILNS